MNPTPRREFLITLALSGSAGGALAQPALCPLFAGKRVAGPVWCNAWVKRP